MTIIDTHAHLDQVENIEEVLKKAKEVGVTSVVAVSTDGASSIKNIEISRKIKEPCIYVAIGIHPECAESLDIGKNIGVIKENASNATAIGEIGLDYWYKWARKKEDKKQIQRDLFRLQLKIAKEHDLPVTIHSRGAWRDCLKIIEDIGIKKAVFHWYSGPREILEEICDKGYFISATPALSYSPQSQEAVKNAPIENTLIETDSPVFFKDPKGVFQATPKDVFRTLELYAQIKNMKEADALSVLNQNACDFFGITL